MTMDSKIEIVGLISMIAGGASAIQLISKHYSDEALEHIAADIEENAWKLLKLTDPEEYKKMQEYWERERQNGN